jgi:hypothetical protein
VGLKHQSWNSTVHATILEGGHGKRKKAIIDRAVKIDCLLKLRLTIAVMFLDQRPEERRLIRKVIVERGLGNLSGLEYVANTRRSVAML